MLNEKEHNCTNKYEFLKFIDQKSCKWSLTKFWSDQAHVFQFNQVLSSKYDEIFCAEALQMHVLNYFRTSKHFSKPDLRLSSNKFGLIEKIVQLEIVLIKRIYSKHTHIESISLKVLCTNFESSLKKIVFVIYF